MRFFRSASKVNRWVFGGRGLGAANTINDVEAMFRQKGKTRKKEQIPGR
jgi:hypothetical protein